MLDASDVPERDNGSINENGVVNDPGTPLIGERETGTVSNTWTLMNFLKGMIGPGCLALPLAFKECGLWLGFALMIVIGFLNAHCMMVLVECSQYLCQKSGKLELDYGHLAKKAADYGPHRFRPHSRIPLYITNAVICVMQLGIGSVLMVFMAVHLKEVVEDISTWQKSTEPESELDKRTYLLIILLPVALLNLIRELRILAILSAIANVLMLIAFAIIFYSLLSSTSYTRSLPAIGSFEGILIGTGAMLYAFEGQAMVLPMENKMIDPSAMKGWNGVLNTGMSITTCIYVATGFFGYATYGKDVQGSIAQSLGASPVDVAVKIMLVISVYVGYGIQLYVVIEMLWPAILRKLPTVLTPYSLPLELCFRQFLVLITFGFAVAVPTLEEIIPLVGVTAGMILAFMVPPFIEIVTYWDDWTMQYADKGWMLKARVLKNLTLVALGCIGLVAGLYANVQNISKN